MGKILDHYMTLVPLIPEKDDVVLPTGSKVTIDTNQFHPILFGGDQLTAARICGTQVLRNMEETHFEGIVPVVEDRHARVTLLKVIIITLILSRMPNTYIVCDMYKYTSRC